ncbi:MAG: DUF2651 family protein [Clostridium sp.]|uniref:DUF2651 family protein n=1 Tax=Clostridium sp. TaxID=1506 RepID=UPI003D6D3602
MFNIFNTYSNESMVMILFIYPLLVVLTSLVMQLIFKRMLIILLINFVFWLIVTFTIFNPGFLIWCFIYTFISMFGTLIGDLIIIHKEGAIKKR